MRAKIIPDFDCEPEQLVFQEGVSAKKTLALRPRLLNVVSVEKAYTSHRAFTATVSGESDVTVEFDASKWQFTDGVVPYLSVRTNSRNEPNCYLDLKVHK